MKVNALRKKIFEEDPIIKSIAKLAVPTVCSQIILVLYNMADTFFISFCNSDAKLTAATICMPALMFLSAIANLFGIGGAGVISRSLGTGNKKAAKKATNLSFWCCFLITALYSLLTLFLGKPFVYLLGARDSEVTSYALSYLRWTIVFGGIPAACGTLFSHLLRAEGRSRQAGIVIMAGGILNTILDPVFMFVLLPKGHEVEGAAIATFTANLIVFIYFVIIIIIRHRKHSILRVRKPEKQRWDKSKNLLPEIFMTGFPAFTMTLFENISYAVLFNLMATSGVSAQAGLGVAKKINMLAHCMVRGMAQGVLPLIAYNYSSKNIKRMQSALKNTIIISTILALICCIISLTFTNALIGIFIKGGASFDYGVSFLRILCIGAPFSASAYVMISFFQAVRDGKRSLILALLRKGLFDIPLMFVLYYLRSAIWAVWSTPITDVVCCVIGIIFLIFWEKSFLAEVEKEASSKKENSPKNNKKKQRKNA